MDVLNELNRVMDEIASEVEGAKDPGKHKQRSWDEYFMGMAQYVGTRSKDPSTKVGAVIVGPDNRVRSTGYNGFPSGVVESSDRTMTRDSRLLYSEHAERNAMYSAAKAGVPTDKCTIYVCGLSPCADCGRAIIQCGIRRVVVSDNTMPLRWGDSMIACGKMFEDAGITVAHIPL